MSDKLSKNDKDFAHAMALKLRLNRESLAEKKKQQKLKTERDKETVDFDNTVRISTCQMHKYFRFQPCWNRKIQPDELGSPQMIRTSVRFTKDSRGSEQGDKETMDTDNTSRISIGQMHKHP